MSEYLQVTLAISTSCTYSAARSFIQFAILYNQLHQGGHLLPASEESLMLYATYLAATIKPQSIKVHLYGVRNLHIENRFPCPLQGVLQLRRLLRGIKRVKGLYPD